MAAPHSAVTRMSKGLPVSRISVSEGFGSTTDALIRAALNLVDTRDPLYGVGGGVLLQGGPLRFDLGYRYKDIQANSALSSLLSAGQELQAHQIRFGVGVRF